MRTIQGSMLTETSMRVAVFGLGYVGSVTASCLAREGHVVGGVDLDQHKVDLINAGSSPIVEPGMEDLVAGAPFRPAASNGRPDRCGGR